MSELISESRATELPLLNQGTTAVATRYALRLILGRGMLSLNSIWGPAMHNFGFHDMGFPGLADRLMGEVTVADAANINNRLQQRLNELHSVELNVDEPLCAGIKALRELFALNDDEAEVLTFCLVWRTCEWLREVVAKTGDLSAFDVFKVISQATMVSEARVRNVLSANSSLRNSGLLSFDLSECERLSKILKLMPGLIELVAEGRVNHETIIVRYATVLAATTLDGMDYEHMEVELNLLREYLSSAFDQPQHGMNILFYGPPGTGKTELARLLVNELQAKGLEITSEDAEGNVLAGDQRLQAYKLLQRVALNQSRVVLVLDEAEDIFTIAEENNRRDVKGRKAWINKTLENNLVPAIWITNNVDIMDHAFLRRFDLLVEVAQPPKQARRRMLTEAWSDPGASEQLIQQFSGVAALGPALIDTAQRVATRNRNGKISSDVVLERVVTAHLRAIGKDIPSAAKARDVEFNLDLINCNVNVRLLIEGLKRGRKGRLLFEGVPGSGKSALARHILAEIEVDMIESGASQILAPYIGETERNIAKLFHEARRFGQAILLDEIDGLLITRGDGSHSWEVTLVNEFLCQLERFDGIFIATTNRLSAIDVAAKRRFDLIANFQSIKASQIETLLNEVRQHWKQAAPISELELARMRELTNVTFGDVAKAVRRCELLGDCRISNLIQALTADQGDKAHSGKIVSLHSKI